MCGIAGFVNASGAPADHSLIMRMTRTLAHRGPDGEGYHLDGPLAFGHRRLAIIDLAGGAQPLANEDQSIWITYNGELYNDPHLRAQLQQAGHRYATHCDTETLVHLYEQHGTGSVALLNGMFAFAIWDAPRKRLLLARDRMGQKPLYYAPLPGGGLAFASEPKALIQHPEIPRALDHASLARYLFYEYLPAPHSIWAGIQRLPAAHWLLWENGRFRIDRYWTPPLPNTQPQTPHAAPADLDATAQTLWISLVAAAERHRRSDVPLGVFLSGGIDSSSVAAALCATEPPRGIQTFSIGFEDPSFDESRHARAVARHLGTQHHERIFSAQNLLDLLPQLPAWLDEPFGDASILPTHLLSRFARELVTVALGGDGADELLAGYPTFAAERAALLYRRIPAPARKLAGAAVETLPVDHKNFSLDFKLKQFLRGIDAPPALAHQRWLGSYSGPEIARLLREPPPLDVEAEHLARAAPLAPGADPLTRSLLLYQDTYLPEDILTKVDRASMATSLEVRAPMLDAQLVDLLQSLPPAFKLHHNSGKVILKRAMRGKLPPQILKRSKKGFGIPVARWLRGPLKPLADDLLGPDFLARQNLFNPSEVARRLAEHHAGLRDHRKPLWTLLVFQLWYRHWLAS
jgi:asparagine synthase (glutamine-hydrolysing)